MLCGTGWTLIGWLLQSALAGNGPWVVGEGGFTLYAGTEAQWLDKLAISVDGERQVLDVGEGLSAFSVKGIATVGFGPRIDLEVAVPWLRVQANREDHPLCATLGLGACDTTKGIGIIRSRLKGLLLDEFRGAPISLAVGAELRSGQLTAATRERVTNLGEGTFDAGPFLDVGRSGGLGKGYWSGWFEAQYRYRVPLTNSFPQNTGSTVVPGSEIAGAAEVILGPSQSVGFGPSAGFLWRPIGLDWDEVDLTDVDRFGALEVANVRVGGTLLFRMPSFATAIAVQRTVLAMNNPTNTFNVSLGIQFDGRLPGVEDG
jgi:hypothetical protein